MTSYRELYNLCNEMTKELDRYRQLSLDDKRERDPLAIRARAALAKCKVKEKTEGPLANFINYFCVNYPTGTIISDSKWHASKIFNALIYAIICSDYFAPQPIPVGERLPGKDDLTSAPHPLLGTGKEYYNDPPQHCCWWWDNEEDTWVFANSSSRPRPRFTHWLPWWAISLPKIKNEQPKQEPKLTNNP